MPLINNTTIAFFIAFVLVVIVPVWFINFIEITFFKKLMFTVAGGVGVYLALSFGSMRSRN